MRNKWTILWLLCLFGLTAVLLAWHRYGMTRTITIDAASSYALWPQDDRGVGGRSEVTLQKTDSAIVIGCQMRAKYAWPYCGLGISIGKGSRGINLAHFTSISLDLHTDGPTAIPVSVYLLNYNPAYSKPDDPESLKINQLQYVPNDAPGTRTVPLANFQIASWWLREHNVPPDEAGADIGNVTAIQVFTGDDVKVGNYKIAVRSIVLHGKWLSAAQLQWIILMLWLVPAAIYLITTIWITRRDVLAMRLEKQQLENINATFKSERDELATIATHDVLTGLYNRVGLRNYLHQIVPRIRRGEQTLSAIFIDIDHFKQINDAHGHVVGDVILKQFADVLTQHTRQGDFCCRWGGEEFLVLCAGTPLAEACILAEKLRVLVAAQSWQHGAELHCSSGVAEIGAAEDPAGFIQRADAALYRAKNAGRNRVYPAADPWIDTMTATGTEN